MRVILRAAVGLMILAVSGCGVTRAPLGSSPGPFRPGWWCRGPHAQTIWGAFFRSVRSVPLTRERWETPDGDFLDVDLLSAPAGAPILVLLHGLEGSSRYKPIRSLLHLASLKGWGAVAMNFRSCSGEPNRLPRSYHGGETSDLTWLLERVMERNPESPILCAGISLGGNVLLKYLGEQGESLSSRIRGAATISAPFDLKASAHQLEKGSSRFYMGQLVRKLRAKALVKLKQYPDLFDRQALLNVRTMEEFDDVVTAPVHGFPDAEAYWAASSSKTFLAKIRRPTLLLNAQDDPFLPSSALPERAVSENQYLSAEFPAAGGHVGFVTGSWPGSPVPWAELRAVQFLERQLS